MRFVVYLWWIFQKGACLKGNRHFENCIFHTFIHDDTSTARKNPCSIPDPSLYFSLSLAVLWSEYQKCLKAARNINVFFFSFWPLHLSPWLHFRFHDEFSHWNIIYHRPVACIKYVGLSVCEYAYLKINTKSNETNIWHKINQII